MRTYSTLILFLLALLLNSGNVHADLQESQIFDEIVKRVQLLIQDTGIAAAISMDTVDTLQINFKTQPFLVHDISMAGQISTNAVTRIGPSYDGFILRVTVQPTGTINQAVVPQTLKQPYWQTYLDTTSLSAKDIQLYWSYSFGSRTDTNLFNRINEIINSLDD